MILTDEQAYQLLNSDHESIADLIKRAYQAGYDQAVKDCQHFEESGVLIF